MKTAQRRWAVVASCLLVAMFAGQAVRGAPAEASSGGSPWRGDYFPNVELVTHDGKPVRFYDDLIKDRVVAINFIFTSCKDVCPGETARLRQVQQLLGDRADQDVFMYSITIDPETDSPEVLAAYREQFKIGPGWTFLTGSEEDIELLQRKLGLLIEDLEDPNDHNVSLIVGNEATGRWMKRSPYDNPHILAGLLMDSLHNWKVPRAAGRSYATAEKLPAFTRGEYLFRTRCNACHTIGQGDGVGPDLIGIVEKRDPDWLARWLMEPDAMIAEEDPIALQILAEYGDVRMPNLRLTDIETTSLIEHLRDESMRVSQARTAEPEPHAHHVAQPGDVGQGGGHGEHAHH